MGCQLQSFRARRRSLARDLEAIEAIESCAQGTSQLDFSDYQRCLLVAAGNSLRNEIAVLQWNDNSLNSLLERFAMKSSFTQAFNRSFQATNDQPPVKSRASFVV